ncbi:MAG: hypothetical protein J6L79_03500, partial [Muribaculaceae bacterium]|nr:hypothetical protein [Muribaculaceae bacterium]
RSSPSGTLLSHGLLVKKIRIHLSPFFRHHNIKIELIYFMRIPLITYSQEMITVNKGVWEDRKNLSVQNAHNAIRYQWSK